ncbi:hypothetical protein PC41400_21510 [Paenibacillus chitinolyticus]|uniref:Uncharacterized protein n=1 Tax=Paenibacillus chitinolyticus TaxID=79263 RepID=A0A410X0K2_9BACL|nr:hypothetical protein [Paenibacillus chitinolyticus]MCY9593706.1 hypothetical protein [Paenibacillus chitinolyticus]MCY9599728.1 hypothetical protein [Paenibacillus chitinolyticus]QAV20103.1 hypothetical protein PC41400_21510 [Paenibacillus chitinolyticus]
MTIFQWVVWAAMKKWHVLFKDEKGKRGWMQTSDLDLWGHVGSLKVINKKLCEIIAIHQVSE